MNSSFEIFFVAKMNHLMLNYLIMQDRNDTSRHLHYTTHTMKE